MLHSKHLLELIARETGDTYKTPAERRAYRAGMSAAFLACDYAAKEYGQRNEIKRRQAAAAKLCGEMIAGLRETVRAID